MNAVLSMVDRQTGQLRSVVLDNVTANNVTNVLGANVAQDTRLLTDSSNVYRRMGAALAGHEAVNHSVGEYVREAERHARFIETAREVGASEDPKDFDGAFDRLIGKPVPKRPAA